MAHRRQTSASRSEQGGRHLLICLMLALGLDVCAAGVSGATEGDGPGLREFRQARDGADDANALLVGDMLFGELQRKYRSVAGFRAYEARLEAAEHLTKAMQQQLSKAARTQVLVVADQIFNKPAPKPRAQPLPIAPARRFYETAVKVFSTPVSIAGPNDAETAFLAEYYDVNLRCMVDRVSQAGQSLSIAESSFQGTHDYALVLPLLHAGERDAINTQVLPRWMCRPDQLRKLSDSCLIHFGFPVQAMRLAQEATQMEGAVFSEVQFYRSAGEKYGTEHPHRAVACLREAMAMVPPGDEAAAAVLRFDMLQVWLDSRNYALAAGEAEQIADLYPEHPDYAKAVWLCYYALSMSNSVDAILLRIDAVLEDPRCRSYRANLLYIKWWALRRQRHQDARVAAVERELQEHYGHNPLIAPIMLSRATDLLASQLYREADAVLTQLISRFPETKAAEQAKRIREKLKTM